MTWEEIENLADMVATYPKLQDAVMPEVWARILQRQSVKEAKANERICSTPSLPSTSSD